MSAISRPAVALPSVARAGAALAALLAVAALVAGLALGVQTTARGGPPGDDSLLYRRVVEDVRAGQGYYPAAVREQRALDYPLRPFVTVRTPVLAEAMALAPGDAARQAAAGLLALVVVAAWAVRLRKEAERPVGAAMALLLLLGAAAAAFYPRAWTQHELWSGLLLSLALAVHGRRGWPLSLALALTAAAVRELAMPVLALMAMMALLERRGGEALAWAAGLALLGAGLAWHAAEVMRVTGPGDGASQGWLALGGWPFVLLQMRWNALLLAAPGPVVAATAALAVLGLGGLGSVGPHGEDRAAMVLAAYGVAFLAVGRPDNAYWGLIIAPLWPVALLGVERTARALAGR